MRKIEFSVGAKAARLIGRENIADVDIRPQTVKKLIQQDNYVGITHNVNYDWAECNEEIRKMNR